MPLSPCGGSVWPPRDRGLPGAEGRSSAQGSLALDTDTCPHPLPCWSASDGVGSVCSARVRMPALTFESRRTSTRIAGSFFPGHRPTTVILSHGYGDTQEQMLPHAQFLHSAGGNI